MVAASAHPSSAERAFRVAPERSDPPDALFLTLLRRDSFITVGLLKWLHLSMKR
jgi:hypothetical protein